MLHWNKVKERKMPKYLRGRFLKVDSKRKCPFFEFIFDVLFKAIRKSKELGKKLDSMLEARGKEEGHLAQLLEDLRIQAIITKGFIGIETINQCLSKTNIILKSI